MITKYSLGAENWLSRLAPLTARMKKHELRYFMTWVKANGGPFSSFSPDRMRFSNVLIEKKSLNV